jgi:DNA replication protein DnaC
MDLNDTNLGEVARDYLARRGINPDDAPPSKPFNLPDYMVEQAEATLRMVLPARFRTAETDHPDVIGWTNRYLADPDTCPDMLLKGPVGTGKSHQAFGALRRVALAVAARAGRMTYQVISHPDFNDAMRPKPDGANVRTLADFQTVDLLVFDDLGAGKTTEWTEDTLHRLVDCRWANQRPTIATTNLTPEKFRSDLDERVVSRLSMSVQVALTGTDRRRGGL